LRGANPGTRQRGWHPGEGKWHTRRPPRDNARLHGADTASRASGSEADRPHKLNDLADWRRHGPADPPSAGDVCGRRAEL